MSPRKNKPPLKLGMDFDEALHRFAKVDPDELPPKSTKIPKVKPQVRRNPKAGQ